MVTKTLKVAVFLQNEALGDDNSFILMLLCLHNHNHDLHLCNRHEVEFAITEGKKEREQREGVEEMKGFRIGYI